jgi:hypothetical protein
MFYVFFMDFVNNFNIWFYAVGLNDINIQFPLLTPTGLGLFPKKV